MSTKPLCAGQAGNVRSGGVFWADRAPSLPEAVPTPTESTPAESPLVIRKWSTIDTPERMSEIERTSEIGIHTAQRLRLWARWHGAKRKQHFRPPRTRPKEGAGPTAMEKSAAPRPCRLFWTAVPRTTFCDPQVSREV